MSTPPPTPTAARPWYATTAARAATVAVAFVVVIAMALAHTNRACVVNGFGNKLCGGDAVAYCNLLGESVVDNPSTFDACYRAGWRDADTP